MVAAAEKNNPCYSFDLQGKLCDTLWEGPGGVMTVTQAPGQPILMATQKFYSPNDSAKARIVYYRKVDGVWRCEVLSTCPLCTGSAFCAGAGGIISSPAPSNQPMPLRTTGLVPAGSGWLHSPRM